MFTHDAPTNVAIIGGREGALREVLKHDTVQKVVMFDTDDVAIKLSRSHSKPLHDCSDIINSTSSCFDDPRVKSMHANVVEKFLIDEPKTKFDVIIIDAQ